MTFEGFPFVIGWELTLLCNLRCAHCGSSAGHPRRDELTTAEALALCDQFPALLVQEVDFTGGEPLLRPDWQTIAARLIALHIPVNVLTNGLNIGTDTVARMKDTGISGAAVSLDGLQQTHDYVRCRDGSFAGVLKTIEALQAASLPFNVITTVNALNLSELPAMLELLRSIGVRFWRLQPLIHMGRVRGHAELFIDRGTIFQIGSFIRAHRGDAVQLICSDGLEYVDANPSERPWRGCSAGIVTCGITSNGKVKGCLSLPDEVVEGDLRRRSLWDIWFDPNSFAYTRGTCGLGPNCIGCERGADCQGGCSSSSYCATGQFHNDAFCFYKSELLVNSMAVA